MGSLTLEQTNFIKNVMEDKGLKNIKIELTGGTEKGDNYLGIVQFVTISHTEKNEYGTTENKKLDVVLKTAQVSECFREHAPIRNAFVREIYIYETVIPEFMIYQNEKGILNPFTGVATMYGSVSTESHENLLLENIKQSGYSLWNRKLPMNTEHVSLVLKEYGKFHAISLAMRHLDREKFDHLTKDMGSIFKGMSDDKMVNMVTVQFKVAFKALGDKNEVGRKGLEKFAEDAFQFFTQDINSPEDAMAVTHGDCWCNNMMFKYEDKKNPRKPTKFCLLDWQISQKSSPVIDFAYFFLAGAEMEIIRDTPTYLKIYHDAISENLRNFGCDPEEVFPYELLLTHWKKYARYGLYMALVVTMVMLRDSEDAPDLQALAEKGLSLVEALQVQPARQDIVDKFNERISNIIIFLAENDLF